MQNRLITLRKTLKLSQTKFGEKISLSRSTIGNMENGTRPINGRTVQLIHNVYNVNKEWLYEGKGNMFNNSENLVELFGYMINDLDEVETKFLTNFLKLSKEDRRTALRYTKLLYMEE